jgi:hypothetical protein
MRLDANRAVEFLRFKLKLIAENTPSVEAERNAEQTIELFEEFVAYQDLTLAQLRDLDRALAEMPLKHAILGADQADLRRELVERFGVSRLGVSDKATVRKVLKRGRIDDLEEYHQVKEFVSCVDNVEVVGEEAYEALDGLLESYDGPGEAADDGDGGDEAERERGKREPSPRRATTVHRATAPYPDCDYTLVEDERLFPPDASIETLTAFLETKFDLVAAHVGVPKFRARLLATKQGVLTSLTSPAQHDKRAACVHAEHEAEFFSWRVVGSKAHRAVEDELERHFGFRRIGPSAQARFARMLARNEREDGTDSMIVERFLHSFPRQTLFDKAAVKRVREIAKRPSAAELERAARHVHQRPNPRAEHSADRSTLRVGAVYVSKDRNEAAESRVIAFDDKVVLREIRYSPNQPWGAGLRRKRIVYFRTPTEWFLHEREFVRVDALTESERALHRPDLPLRLCESDGFGWADCPHGTRAEFLDWIGERAPELLRMDPVRAERLALVTFSGDGFGAREVLEADGDGMVAMDEILWRACLAMVRTRRRPTVGFGIYRMGVVDGNIPAYGVIGYRENELPESG